MPPFEGFGAFDAVAPSLTLPMGLNLTIRLRDVRGVVAVAGRRRPVAEGGEPAASRGARAEGIEPPTAGFGDRCSTN